MKSNPEVDEFFDMLGDVATFDHTPIWDDLNNIMWVSSQYHTQEWVDRECKRLGIVKPTIIVDDLSRLKFDDYPDDLEEYLELIEVPDTESSG